MSSLPYGSTEPRQASVAVRPRRRANRRARPRRRSGAAELGAVAGSAPWRDARQGRRPPRRMACAVAAGWCSSTRRHPRDRGVRLARV